MTTQDVLKNVGRRHRVLVENPHPQSYAARVLLRTMLSMETRAEWLEFRKSFLAKEKEEKGDLVCAFCGATNLKEEVEFPHTKSRLRELATLDHVNPRCNGGSEYDPKNLVVACHPCNHKKGSSTHLAHLGL
jgi:5-methylcytosine-specific restriction endonuclease McrA